jgi:molybdate transport system permease protein
MIAETLINLPMILPPSVVGYYLLLVLGRSNPLIVWLEWQILFTWQGAVIASTVVGIPLMTQASKAALASIDPVIENAARTLGSTEWEVFRRVTLPLAKRGILAGMILGSARALGEFGATLMIAGNIPGRTQTLPLAIYDAVQSRNYDEANRMVILMTMIAFTGLWLVRRLDGQRMKQRG